MSNEYPLIRETRDGELIISQLAADSLQKIENTLGAYKSGKIDIAEPRLENGEPNPQGDFQLTVYDVDYTRTGVELDVLRWNCDYCFDTDRLIEAMKEYEKTQATFSKLFAVASYVEVDIKDIMYVGGYDEEGHERKDNYSEAVNAITYYPSPTEGIIFADNESEGDYEDPMPLSEAVINVLGYIDASVNNSDISVGIMFKTGDFVPVIPKQAGEGMKLIEDIIERFVQAEKDIAIIFSQDILDVLNRNCFSNYCVSREDNSVSMKWHSPMGDIPVTFSAANAKEFVDGFAKFANEFDAESISVKGADGIRELLHDISDKLYAVMENMQYSYTLPNDVYNRIYNMGANEKIQLDNFYNDVVVEITKDVSFDLTRMKEGDMDCMNLVTIDFLQGGKSIVSTYDIHVSSLENALNEIRNGISDCLVDEDRSLAEIVADKSEPKKHKQSSIERD